MSKQHGRRELRKITGSEILSLGCFQGYVQFKVLKVDMFKANIRNTRTRYEICSKLTIKTPERRHWRRLSLLLTFNTRRIAFEHNAHSFEGA